MRQCLASAFDSKNSAMKSSAQLGLLPPSLAPSLAPSSNGAQDYRPKHSLEGVRRMALWGWRSDVPAAAEVDFRERTDLAGLSVLEAVLQAWQTGDGSWVVCWNPFHCAGSR